VRFLSQQRSFAIDDSSMNPAADCPAPTTRIPQLLAIQRMFTAIPIVIYHEIKPFLKNRDYCRLMSTSQTLFEQVKKETIDITISDLTSVQAEANYEENILPRLIVDPSLQLSIDYMDSNRIDIFERTFLWRCKRVVASKYFNKVKKWKSMLNCKIMELSEDDSTKNFKGLNPSIQVLKLWKFSALINASHLAHLQELSLYDCPSVVDVSCLGDLRKLELCNCPSIEDVSGLKNVYELSIQGCEAIKNFNVLNNNRKLTLFCLSSSLQGRLLLEGENLQKLIYLRTNLVQTAAQTNYLHQVKDLSLKYYQDSTIYLPKNLQKLEFVGALFGSAFRISNFAELTHLKFDHLLEVSFESCVSLTTLNGFEHVANVTVSSCSSLVDISALGNQSKRRCKNIVISNCNRIASYAPLQNAWHVELSKEVNSASFSLEDLENVHHLVLHSMSRGVIDVNVLKNVYHLEFNHVDNLEGISALGNVPILAIRGQVKNLQGLGVSNQKLIFLPTPQTEKLIEDIQLIENYDKEIQKGDSGGFMEMIYTRKIR
jgi:hypothetical protein